MATELKQKLIGEQLSSVEFIQDYVQLHFDGRNLISYIWPVVIKDEMEFKFEQPFYRDRLCDLIGQTVVDVLIKEEDYLDIVFQDGSFRINLDPKNPEIVSEIAIFNDTLDNSWSVFE